LCPTDKYKDVWRSRSRFNQKHSFAFPPAQFCRCHFIFTRVAQRTDCTYFYCLSETHTLNLNHIYPLVAKVDSDVLSHRTRKHTRWAAIIIVGHTSAVLQHVRRTYALHNIIILIILYYKIITAFLLFLFYFQSIVSCRRCPARSSSRQLRIIKYSKTNDNNDLNNIKI